MLEITQNNSADKSNEVDNTNQLNHDELKFLFDYNIVLIAYLSLYQNMQTTTIFLFKQEKVDNDQIEKYYNS